MKRKANLLLTACAAAAVALGSWAGVHAGTGTDRNPSVPYAVTNQAVPIDPLVVQDMNHGTTAQAMAQSLLGGGVTISNVVYTGAPNAAGLFSGGAGSESIIGFDSGIVMGSGSVQTVAPHNLPCSKGVEGPNQCSSNTTVNGTPGDPDLTALSGHPTFDAAILQFDFVPQFATAQFKYVFSSDEYNEFANSPFNDVFAFLVNGVNCALVPGTNLPVAVNTINGGNPIGTNPQHPQFFRDNDPATRPVAINTEMDGLTTVLTCNTTVNAGVSNHMKLAIADATDSVLDSNVFIAGGSLVSGTQISTTLSGGGQSGASITVPNGTAVTDAATLSGANAASAGGSVHYQVYSGTICDVAHLFADAGTKTVSNGQVPSSDPLTFSQAGTFNWQASYSGDALNNPSINACGSETLTVIGGPSPDGYLQFTLPTAMIDLYDQAGHKLTAISSSPGFVQTEHGPVPVTNRTYTFSVAGSNSTTIWTTCTNDNLNCSIVGIQYGSKPKTTPTQDLLSVQYYRSNEGYTSLNQQVYIGNALDTAEWNAGPNTTTLKHVRPSPATSQTLPGMVLLQIWTKNGNVVFNHS